MDWDAYSEGSSLLGAVAPTERGVNNIGVHVIALRVPTSYKAINDFYRDAYTYLNHVDKETIKNMVSLRDVTVDGKDAKRIMYSAPKQNAYLIEYIAISNGYVYMVDLIVPNAEYGKWQKTLDAIGDSIRLK
jgi:hypothetical protein